MDLLYWQVEPHYILGITPSEACLYGTVDGWWPLNNPQRGLAAHGPKCTFFHSFTTISKLCPEAVCLLDKGGVGGPYEPKMLALPERGGLCPLPGFFLENLSTMHCNAVRALQSAHLSPKSDKLPQTISLWWNIIKNNSNQPCQKVSPLHPYLAHGVL